MRLGKIFVTAAGGELWQGSQPDFDVQQIAAPLVVVSVAHDATGAYSVPDVTKFGLLKVAIPDAEEGVLADKFLVGLAESLAAWLRAGINVLVHCLAGESRSSYVTVAVVSSLTGWSIDRSLEWIRARYEFAGPRPYFWAHLRALEAQLRG